MRETKFCTALLYLKRKGNCVAASSPVAVRAQELTEQPHPEARVTVRAQTWYVDVSRGHHNFHKLTCVVGDFGVVYKRTDTYNHFSPRRPTSEVCPPQTTRPQAQRDRPRSLAPAARATSTALRTHISLSASMPAPLSSQQLGHGDVVTGELEGSPLVPL